MEHIFIRGSRVRYVIVPDMLKNAPMVRGRVMGDRRRQRVGVWEPRCCLRERRAARLNNTKDGCSRDWERPSKAMPSVRHDGTQHGPAAPAVGRWLLNWIADALSRCPLASCPLQFKRIDPKVRSLAGRSGQRGEVAVSDQQRRHAWLCSSSSGSGRQ